MSVLSTRHEIDKLVSSQRLDLNLEKGWVWTRCIITKAALLACPKWREKLGPCCNQWSVPSSSGLITPVTWWLLLLTGCWVVPDRRMRDELHALRDKTNDLELKIDRVIWRLVLSCAFYSALTQHILLHYKSPWCRVLTGSSAVGVGNKFTEGSCWAHKKWNGDLILLSRWASDFRNRMSIIEPQMFANFHGNVFSVQSCRIITSLLEWLHAYVFRLDNKKTITNESSALKPTVRPRSIWARTFRTSNQESVCVS